MSSVVANGSGVLPARPVQAKLVVHGVTRVFRSRRSEVHALGGVDLHVDDGELVCLLGA
jgi:hypothetical protein